MLTTSSNNRVHQPHDREKSLPYEVHAALAARFHMMQQVNCYVHKHEKQQLGAREGQTSLVGM